MFMVIRNVMTQDGVVKLQKNCFLTFLPGPGFHFPGFFLFGFFLPILKAHRFDSRPNIRLRQRPFCSVSMALRLLFYRLKLLVLFVHLQSSRRDQNCQSSEKAQNACNLWKPIP
jgi:hypothetical protein